MGDHCPCMTLYFKQTSETCNRRFKSLEKDIIYALYLEELIKPTEGLDIEEIEESDESALNDKWNLFWSVQGDEIVLRTWASKYSEYLESNYDENSDDTAEQLEDNTSSENTDNTSTDSDNEICYCSLINLDDILNIIRLNSVSEISYFADLCLDTPDEDWNTLWEKHYNNQYKLNFAIFSEIFSSLPDISGLDVIHRSTLCIGKMGSELETSSCNAELKACGLPTSFGKKRRQNLALGHSSGVKCKKSCVKTASKNVDQMSESSNSVIETNSVCDENEEQQGEDGAVISSDKASTNVKSLSIPKKKLLKYKKKRFSLFSRFDEGIKLDEESWFSVTPEKIAKHIAKRLKCPIIVDAFCGCGGNTIQFAFTCERVIAIDIDPVKIELAKHNAKIYGVEEKIDFIIGDFLTIFPDLIADVVFLSPPWGGPDYAKTEIYDIEEQLLPLPASQLLEITRKITSNICLYLPKNSNIEQIHKTHGEDKKVEIETSYLDKRTVALSVYYGELCKSVI